ncbi:hypothetical protein K6959_15955 [Bacillus aquiflavi]|uniref:hypothetical protein n=1 Tax=Bacillus aquiflavi TaxID=2672567 RepID=UPI001CA8AFBB|nr:hypothetical protein [Bacillus aquiflavi]UAC48056.1 hypothetical protein K6959_15955 [Bacillus aquiflavi]
MKKLALFFCLIISTFIITACGTPSTEEVFKKVNEAHKKVDSVEVKFSEHSINQDDKVTGTQKFDFKNNMIYITNDKTNEIYYKDKDDFIISSDDSVEKIEDDSKYVFEIKLKKKQQKERKTCCNIYNSLIKRFSKNLS